MDINQIRKANLRNLYKKYGGPAGVAKIVGTSESYLSQITSEKGKRNLGNALARKIEDAYDYPRGWMDLIDPEESYPDNELRFSNDGLSPWDEGYNPPPSRYSTQRIDGRQQSFVSIPYYRESHLSAGNGYVVDIDKETDLLTFQAAWLRKMSLQPEYLVVVRCKGDSMEPRIKDDDIVLVNTQVHDFKSIEDGKIYAINYAGEARIKRLIKRFDGSLVISSDNQSPEYSDEIVTPDMADQLKIIGKAVWVGGML